VSKPTAYYNEIDPIAAAWLRELINAGHIAPGEVDERDIRDVRPDDLAGFRQCHFFAGIGVWSYALRRAGWCDDREIWTASCPCQPFSTAGKNAGFEDDRHLWPAFNRLRAANRPVVAIGEQVASKDGLAWLDLVQADVEASGDAFGAVDICSAGFGAPHIRQRLHWVAHAAGGGQPEFGHALVAGCGGHDDGRIVAGGVEYTHSYQPPAVAGNPGEMRGFSETQREPEHRTDVSLRRGGNGGPGPTNGIWRAADWVFCRDGKWRPVEPGTFPLAHGAPARVGRLRGYGNAINAEVATGFIEAVIAHLADPLPLSHSTTPASEEV
jgi:DNA (cytosine-5)-methyltransferase 1